MENHTQHSSQHASGTTPAPAAWKGAAIMVAVIAAFYLLREHWGHALGIAPYLILLACPLMHLFMHGGHGNGHRHGHPHGDSGNDGRERDDPVPRP